MVSDDLFRLFADSLEKRALEGLEGDFDMAMSLRTAAEDQHIRKYWKYVVTLSSEARWPYG